MSFKIYKLDMLIMLLNNIFLTIEENRMPKVTEIMLELNEGGKKTRGLKEGDGEYPCLIVGPGSFYLNRLSDELKTKFTFFTFDMEWTREKSNPERAPSNITASDMIAHTGHIIASIKSNFRYSKIGLMGFSAPALIALQSAINYKEDVAYVIAIGCALSKLDAQFNATNERFNNEVDEKRREKYSLLQKNFSKLLSGEGGDPLVDSNFIKDEKTGKKRLTPNSQYVEMCRSIIVKLLYDPEKYEAKFLKNWRFNADNKVINEPERQYFFGTILPMLDPSEIINKLEQYSDVPTLLIYGENDYITPIEDNVIKNLKRCEVIKYTNCGHSPNEERSEDFDQDVYKFVNKNISLKIHDSEQKVYTKDHESIDDKQEDSENHEEIGIVKKIVT